MALKSIEEKIISLALKEDIGSGDITTQALIDKSHESEATIKTKSHGVVAGIRVAKEVFNIAGFKVNFKTMVRDGDFIKEGTVIAIIQGKSYELLQAERTVLNFMQRMSGIATTTNVFVNEIKDTCAKILDTRKTAPCLRLFDKEAVKLGGGINHRIGLYDMVLIKDNHIAVSGNIQSAIKKTRSYLADLGQDIKIEVEVSNLMELEQALNENPDVIMLDNFDTSILLDAVSLKNKINPKVLIEVSGNVSMSNVKKIAMAGVDYISVGCLTHSVKSLDIAMSFLSKQ